MIDPESNERRGRPVIREFGMLIEILPDSKIQFMHFSAKELGFPPGILNCLPPYANNIVVYLRYILAGNGGGLHLSPFLSRIDIHLNAFKVCIRYLSSDFFDTGAASTVCLLNGDYNLISYCKNYWIVHLKECLIRLEPDIGTRMVDAIVPTLPNFLLTMNSNTAAGRVFIIPPYHRYWCNLVELLTDSASKLSKDPLQRAEARSAS